MPEPKTGTDAPRRWGPRTLLLLLFLALLAVSHLVRAVRPDEPPPLSGTSVLTVRTVQDDREIDHPIRLAYRDSGILAAMGRTPVLLLHGSPGSKADFDAVVPRLATGRRLIIPDLPGFGESTRDVPDYSIRAHARYMLQLLDRLELERVHVVSFSMGGGVGLNLYDIAPRRVESLTLLSAIGVQEYELFGDYRLNHGVHGIQLGLLWLGREGLPHMGSLDRTLVGVPYARNFYDSDQRPLREILLRFRPPMLILHGERDFLVPPEAAREHHRLAPQSRLELLDRSHFMLFDSSSDTGQRVASFLNSVDAGEATGRDSVPAERQALALAPFDPASIPTLTGIALLLMMLVISVATVFSEDLTCIGVGLLVAQGRIDFLPGVIACCVGILIGDLALFLAGRWLGRPWLDRVPLRWLLRPDVVELSSRWFARRGPVVIGLSRFMPGTRTPTYFAAGMLRTSLLSFSLYFLLAVVIWTPLLVGLSALLGERAERLFDSFQRFALPGFILFCVWILIVVKLIMPLFTFHGRRQMAGRWCRLTRWEFWPSWLFYPPVLLYVAGLMLRYRSPLLFTASNPAIPGGGFVAESKGAILDGLSGAGRRVARTLKIVRGEDLGRRRAEAREFMRRNGLDYPVVLKPDAGQRGSGVAVIRDEERLDAYLSAATFDTLIQEYAPGAEFGIFYYRYPGEERGKIFSITEKRMPVLYGDGVHTVEQLILLDQRAVCMARYYLRVHADRLWQVPAKGELLTLVELGTHCRGAIFLDGAEIGSDALERAIDEVSKSFRGFYFGRYDLKAEDLQALRRGEGFKIIELNGVTSEATHIYDPRVGLIRAYRTLFRQWRIAFEIGRRNRLRGARPSRLRDLLGLMREYRVLARSHPG